MATADCCATIAAIKAMTGVGDGPDRQLLAGNRPALPYIHDTGNVAGNVVGGDVIDRPELVLDRGKLPFA